MIKVTENGVPLSAVVSVEFNDPLGGTFHEPKLDPGWYAHGAYLPATKAEVNRLRYEWLAAWPEIADFWPKR